MIFPYRKAQKSYIVATTIFLLYLLPFVIEWDNSVITDHDNLESSFVYYVVLAQEGKTFALNPNAEIDRVMDGLPRMFFPSGFNVVAVLCLVFPPYLAYLLNFIFVHAIAFLGMHAFLRRHVLQDDEELPIVIFASLAFSLIPFYVIYGLTIAGVPLLIYSLFNFYKGSFTKSDYIICALFPFYSSFFFTGIFVLSIFGVLFLIDAVKRKSLNKDLLISIALLTGLYILIEYQIFYLIVFKSNIVLHRAEFLIQKVDFERSIEIAKDIFLNIQYHTSNAPQFIVTLSFIAVLIGIIKNHKYTSLLMLLFACNLGIAFIQVLYHWKVFADLIKGLPFIDTFQWDRFYALSPTIWYIQFGVAIKIVYDSISQFKWSKALIIAMCCIQFYFLWRDSHDYRRTASNLLETRSYTSFKSFYSNKLFTEIKDYLGRPPNEYRVGCVGFHPAVAQFNGFYTIDGYQSIYPLSYKKKFRTIIADELKKEDSFRRYFDEWGSRCYLLVNDIGQAFSFDPQTRIKSAEAHFNFLLGPEVHFILSAVEIKNPNVSDLELLKVFESGEAAYKIYLYKVKTIDLKELGKQFDSFDPASGIIGVVSELGLAKTYFDTLGIQSEILPRKELLSQSARFKMLVVDGKANLQLITNPSEIAPEDLDIHLLTGYWDYSRDNLIVAAPTTLQSLPIKVDPGVYELSITGESTVVENVTSQIGVNIDGIEIAKPFLPEKTQKLQFQFTVDKAMTAPLSIKFLNDHMVGNNDRNFWLREVRLIRIK